MTDRPDRPVARSLLIPGYDVDCQRCGVQAAVRCGCRPLRLPEGLGDRPLAAAQDLELATVHEPGCSPPARCARCGSPRWWIRRRPRSGPGTWKRGGGRPAYEREDTNS